MYKKNYGEINDMHDVDTKISHNAKPVMFLQFTVKGISTEMSTKGSKIKNHNTLPNHILLG